MNSGERYWRLVELGFDAVPALIEHLDDDRLTRATMTEFNNVWPMRIQHVVSDLIEGLAAEELGRGTAGEDEVGRKRSHRQEGYPVTKRAANEWWEKARKVGEEAYLKERVLPVRRAEGKPAQVNEHLLRVIAAKYPMHVPSLYQTVLDKRTELPSWGLAQALIRSKLQEKDKFDLLRHAVKHKQLEHRLSALEAIKELDRHEFTTLLLAAIEALPTDVPGEYWLCQEVKVAALAVETDDPGVWAAVGKAIKRSAVGLRMEILTVFASPRDTRRLVERYRLLTSFLDDAEVRDLRSDKRFLGGGAGDSYQRLEVRNLVAIELAQLMAIDVKEKPDRSPGEWARLRDLVRDEVKRELGRAK